MFRQPDDILAAVTVLVPTMTTIRMAMSVRDAQTKKSEQIMQLVRKPSNSWEPVGMMINTK